MTRRGVLWDMEGALVDTGEFHYRSWAAVLPDYGIEFSREFFREAFGMNNRLVDQLGLRDCFDILASGVDLPGTPEPALFLKAARLLEVQPDYCIIVEDSAVGVEAAKRASMKCIAVTTTSPAEALAAADVVVERLDVLPADTFQRLVAGA